MNYKKVLRCILSIISILVMIVSILVLSFGIWYLSIGSQETHPTEEQKGKAAGAAIICIVIGLLGTGLGLFLNRKIKRNMMNEMRKTIFENNDHLIDCYREEESKRINTSEENKRL